MARSIDAWYNVAGTLEAYAELHEAFLLEVGEYISNIESLAGRLSAISDREATAVQVIDGRVDISAQVWGNCKTQIASELSRHRLALVHIVQNAALLTDDIRRLGSTVIRP